MPKHGDFSASTAVALVLGGIAALALATSIALGGYGRPKSRAVPASGANNAAPAGGAPTAAEIEYLLDTSE
jgi:hypothetical protein